MQLGHEFREIEAKDMLETTCRVRSAAVGASLLSDAAAGNRTCRAIMAD